MRDNHLKISRRWNPDFETMEDRAVPATFGVPWADPSHLSLSFAPDTTSIASHTSTLFQSMNKPATSTVWQREILRAFQTWAINSNINIAVAADGGQAFGTAGTTQHDPRFGDIRIGAQSMSPEVLSISVPNDPTVSSTMTGDVLINSNDRFDQRTMDVYSVLLHEAGHVFGIDDSTDTRSVMYSKYLQTSKLSAADIAALQELYGTRAPDANEGSSGNDSTSKATALRVSGSAGLSVPIVTFGDITTHKDTDFYKLAIPSNAAGTITVRLQSAGRSLLAPRLSILDSQGRTIATGQANSGFGDIVSLRFAPASANATYLFKVEGAASDVFGIGSYGLSVAFDSSNRVDLARLDSILRGPYELLAPSDLEALITGRPGVLFNDDLGSNDDLTAATTLSPKLGYARETRYETVGSLSSATDFDFYRIKTAPKPPQGKSLVLTVTTRALDPNGATPRVTIVDADGMVVPSEILANGNGSFTIQAKELQGGGHYLLRVGPSTALGSASSGNYALEAQFGAAAAQLDTLALGSLTPSTPTLDYTFYVGQSQLMNLVLNTTSPAGSEPGAGVAMSVVDKTGKVVYRLLAPLGETVSGSALLILPGEYTIHYAVVGSLAIDFRLRGGSISDPIGPVLADTTLTPQYQAPGMPGWFLYPGGVLTLNPFVIQPIVNPAARPR